jgi:hypothetical protein
MRLTSIVAVIGLLVVAGCHTVEKSAEGPKERPTATIPTTAERGSPDEPDRGTPLPLQASFGPGNSVDVQRPARVRGRLDTPLRRDWNYIVVHHSHTDAGSEAIFDRYHREERGWRGVGYDFVIGNGDGSADGMIEVTFRWEKQIQGAHAGVQKYNDHGIGICLVGDFQSHRPTGRQMQSLVALVGYLQEKCHIPSQNVLGHRHVKNTKCPGRNFPWFEFLSRLPH